MEWKLTYVGSAESERDDQVLETILVGPVIQGCHRFVLQANAPDAALIPQDCLLGVTVIILTCSYKDQEFVRVGYFVNNEYTDPLLLENPPSVVDISKVTRNILAEKPRVTRFQIKWD